MERLIRYLVSRHAGLPGSATRAIEVSHDVRGLDEDNAVYELHRNHNILVLRGSAVQDQRRFANFFMEEGFRMGEPVPEGSKKFLVEYVASLISIHQAG